MTPSISIASIPGDTPVSPSNTPRETATWVFRIGDEKQHCWLAEQSGWKIVQKNESDGRVTIQAVRRISQIHE